MSTMSAKVDNNLTIWQLLDSIEQRHGKVGPHIIMSTQPNGNRVITAGWTQGRYVHNCSVAWSPEKPPAGGPLVALCGYLKAGSPGMHHV